MDEETRARQNGMLFTPSILEPQARKHLPTDLDPVSIRKTRSAGRKGDLASYLTATCPHCSDLFF